MFKIGDIVRFVEDDDEWKIIGVGREGGDIAYMVIGLPYLVPGDKLKLVRPSTIDQAFAVGDKVQYFAHGQLYPHSETFTITNVTLAYDTEREKDVPMYDLYGEFGTWLYNVEQQYLQRTQANYTLF